MSAPTRNAICIAPNAKRATRRVVPGSSPPGQARRLAYNRRSMGQIEELWQQTLQRAARRPPEATYRLQFHAGFTFRDATRIVPYLRDLGITHCYASPYLRARPGSIHGYDIVDHSMLNPEIGTPADYDDWVDALEDAGLGQVIDIVPNHMAVATNENAWWNDVLENGPASRYSDYFDIAWRASPRAELQDKVLL